MKISPEDGILIENIYLSKQCECDARRLLHEFPRLRSETWKHRQSAKENPQGARVLLSGNHAAVDRVRRVAVKDLVFSQEDTPKRHWSTREISCETSILCSCVHCAQDNSP